MSARYVTFKTFAGFVFRGERTVDLDDFNTRMHLDRTVWLTSQLEASRWGTVQSYDGAGVSGGLLHNIAVLPKTLEQGSLWQLLARIRLAAPVATGALERWLASDHGCRIDETGTLRFASGMKVPGSSIRQILNESEKGLTPKSGEAHLRSQKAIEMFHKVLSDPRTFRAQTQYAIEWMANGHKADEIKVYRGFVDDTIDSPIGLPTAAIPEPVDLAMAVYHSFSVNGPAPAVKCLRAALDVKSIRGNPKRFAEVLIRKLGTNSYGRWHDDPDDKSGRYDATRKAVERSGLWDRKLVQAVMPRNLA